MANSEGESLKTCADREVSVKQEFATADSAQFSGVTEHTLGLIETAAMVDRIKAREFFPGAQ